jgi:glycyl-tRNA synthetase beta subunit
MENSQQKERLTGFMAQGYIDQILYNEEMNTLLAQADRYNAEIEMLSNNVKGDASHIQTATSLLRFTEKSSMLDSFDEELFEETVNYIRVLSREKIAFELKCGLTLTERM